MNPFYAVGMGLVWGCVANVFIFSSVVAHHLKSKTHQLVAKAVVCLVIAAVVAGAMTWDENSDGRVKVPAGTTTVKR